VPVLGGTLDITVNVAGKGKPLVYLHSAGGFYWDDFLDDLADHYKVYVPHFPARRRANPMRSISSITCGRGARLR
jgi:hypothetical protein